MKIKINELQELAIKAYTNRGISRKDAELLVDERLDAELRGRKSHGFIEFSVPDTSQIKGPGKIVKEGPSFAVFDGQCNFGTVVGEKALELAIEKAKKTGIAIVGIHNVKSWLMPGTFARKAVQKGMIGIVFDNSRSRTAPTGGIDPRLGANPIGIGIPSNSEPPLVIDMATSIRAMGEVRLAKTRGTSIPDNWAIDKDGNATTDPCAVNALYPAGHSYKMYALALAIEILAGALVGAKMGNKIKDKFDRGFAIIIIDPRKLTDIGRFKKSVSELISYVKSSRKAPGVSEIRIPGEQSEHRKQDALKRGYIDLDEKTVENIKKLAMD